MHQLTEPCVRDDKLFPRPPPFARTFLRDHKCGVIFSGRTRANAGVSRLFMGPHFRFPPPGRSVVAKMHARVELWPRHAGNVLQRSLYLNRSTLLDQKPIWYHFRRFPCPTRDEIVRQKQEFAENYTKRITNTPTLRNSIKRIATHYFKTLTKQFICGMTSSTDLLVWVPE